ncbi:MAG: NnrS family protein [Oligoflexia bacterium]|nr:NnrS family protein [Oligoflexia bacterium]
MSSIIGVFLWVLFYFNLISVYPIQSHSRTMIMGFLFSFVSGFLMTAVPRMTGTTSISSRHYLFTLIGHVSFLIVSLLGLTFLSQVLSIGLFLNLLLFFAKRKRAMKKTKLPSGFIFIPVGLGMGLFGQILILLAAELDLNTSTLGKLFLYEGFILNLIIGLGSRLIPILTRKINALSPMDIKGLSPRLLLMEALLFNGSFIVEAFYNSSLGVLIRSIVFVIILTKNFNFFDKIIQPSKLAIGLIVAQALIPLTYFLVGFFPEHRAHLIHIVYIGSIALLTFLVSVRVTLAHGTGAIDLERTSSSIVLIVIFMMTAVVLRVLAPIIYNHHFLLGTALAGTSFIGAASSWLLFLRPQLFRAPN